MENVIEQAAQAESTGAEQDVQGTKGEKLFTQEEVNSFIQSRISRMKGQAAKEAEAEYNQKLADLEMRERKVLLKERLADRGMPKELADIITGTDEKDIDAKLDALQKLYGSAEKQKDDKQPTGFIQIGVAGNSGPVSGPDPIRAAMGLD